MTLPVSGGGTGATTLSGLLKGNGTSPVTAATAGSDYVAPGGVLGTPSSGTLTNCTLPLTGLVGAGVAYVPAPTGTASTDTTNIQDAINALGTAGGDVVLQGGAYFLTAAGITIANPTRLLGAGAWGPAGYPTYGSWLYSDSATATAITVTAAACVIENLYIGNSGSVTATSGYGIKITGASSSNPSTAYIHRCQIANYYDNIVFANSCEFFSVANCEVLNPIRYGIRVANPANPDQGDNIIYDTKIITTPAATSGIRLESGGARVALCKILGAFATGVDFAIVAGATTSDVFIHDNSLESFTATGISFSQQTPGSGVVGNVLVLGNEFEASSGTTCVSWGEGYSNGVIANNTASAGGTGITLESGCGALTIGVNAWSTVTAAIVANSGATADVQIAPQHLLSGNTLLTTTPTAAGTTTLSISSTPIQQFTGTSTQTVKLPTTSVMAGTQYTIINSSTGSVTVQSSGANTIGTLTAGTSAIFTALVAAPTAAANWFQK